MLLFWAHCGTECWLPVACDLTTGEVGGWRSEWLGCWPPAYSRFVFSADRRWFAGTYYSLRPETVVGQWGISAEWAHEAAGTETRYVDAQF